MIFSQVRLSLFSVIALITLDPESDEGSAGYLQIVLAVAIGNKVFPNHNHTISFC